jgi:hypothetical protein
VTDWTCFRQVTASEEWDLGYKEDDGWREVNREQDRQHEQFQEALRRQQKRHEQSRKMAESLFRESYVPASGRLYGDPIAPPMELGSPHFATTEYLEVQPQESVSAKAKRLLTEILASTSDPIAAEMAVGLARDPYLADEDKLTLLAMLEAQLRE